MAAPGSRSLKAAWIATRLAAPFSTRLAGVFASRLWFTPWVVPLSDRALRKQASWLRPTRPVTFGWQGAPIRGFVAGEGPTVLLVHGWGERAANLGGFVEPLTGAGFRVVGIDMPGHGRTSRGRTNIFELSAAVREVADELGGLHAVVAHSMGGYVTTVAIAEGLDLEAVALLAPATHVDRVMDKFATMFALPPRAIRGLRDDITRRFGADVWDRLDTEQLVGDFHVPALVVHDREDPQVDLADSEDLVRIWPEARLIVTTGLGHDKITRDPAVIGTIQEFLDETRARDERRLASASAAH